MTMDVLIVCTPSVWDAVATDLPWITGFFDDPAPRKVYNVLAQQSELDALVNALEAHTPGAVSAKYAWVQGRGLDSLDWWPTDPAAVAMLMPDTTKSHVFLGQSTRIYAGDFDNAFSEEFR